jgi:hypothetical protein
VLAGTDLSQKKPGLTPVLHFGEDPVGVSLLTKMAFQSLEI